MSRTDRRQITIRQSLLNNMLLLVVLVGVAVLITTFVGANQVTQSLSRVLIGQTIDRTEAQVAQFMTPVRHAASLLTHWARDGQIDPTSGAGGSELVWPLLQASNQLYGALIVGPDQRVLQVNRRLDVWSMNLVDGEGREPARTRPLESSTAAWQPIDYQFVPRERPWYQSASEAPEGEIRWTEAYRFIGSNHPGITASAQVKDRNGETWVVALDVLLEDISEFTRNFDMGYQGLVLVTDEQGQILGLPNLPQYASQSAREVAFLKQPHELGLALAVDASQAFTRADGSVETEPVRFRSEGRYWWGQAKWIPLNASQELFTGVLVPEAELLGSIQQLRLLVLSVVLAVVAFAVYRAISLSQRYSRPISQLADQSLRISRGDLDAPAAQIRSSLREVTNLADAHEAMRDGLSNLLKLEDELQLARQIQQKTFPQSFPLVKGYDIAAGSRPADATGGDTYDVIGVRRGEAGMVMVDDDPDEVFMVLSDATGHGMGPALTAAQVRSMFRMGIRLGQPLEAVARHMNDQLVADAHRGRFVTAWMGLLCARGHRLRLFSAGQAPILWYHAASDTFEAMDADAPPLGVMDGMAVALHDIVLEPGDILAVISDGAFEARASDGERFGQERVEQLIRVNAQKSAAQLLNEMADAVTRFVDQRAPDDDQTGLFIRRL
ncbi:MAG: SpoIIE family protein phosphatase [Pseudomonadota bacterium]